MTIPWLETTPTAQSTMTTPLRTAQETMPPSKTQGKGEAPTANREGGPGSGQGPKHVTSTYH
jgi:hypothetical protein